MPEEKSQFTCIYRTVKSSSIEELEKEVNRILQIKPHRWSLSTGLIQCIQEGSKLVYVREMIGLFPKEDIILSEAQEPLPSS